MPTDPTATAAEGALPTSLSTTQPAAPGPNHDLFIDVLARVERDPAAWNQGTWGYSDSQCGTVACFAGHAVVESGVPHSWQEVAVDGGSVYRVLRPDSGLHVRDQAQRLLGLTHDQASRLFYETNTRLDSLYRTCASILGVDPDVLRDKVQDRLTSPQTTTTTP
jgi:hypothetical protein